MRRLTHQARVLLLAGALALPGLVVSGGLLFAQPYSLKVRLTVFVVLLASGGAATLALLRLSVWPLRSASNLLASLREEDFTLRAATARPSDVLGQLSWEINALSDTLHAQRLGALETRALLRKMLAQLQVAVVGLDSEARVSFSNLAAERLLECAAAELLGKSADEVGLAQAMESQQGEILDLSFPGGTGRWEVRRTSYMEEGREQHLLLLSDLSPALREEERRAWERLIQVLRHEVNNSLAPIQSLAETLARKLAAKPADWESNVNEGLELIGSRSRSLGRFLESYSRLARQPAPELSQLSLRSLVESTLELETRMTVKVQEAEDCEVLGDRGQLEQLLLNLIRNAVEAAELESGTVEVGWEREAAAPRSVSLFIDDDGPGIGNPENLFVPFFTTKPEGTGVGLVVSRQIAEAHGGSLELHDREGRKGCRALLRLPAASW